MNSDNYLMLQVKRGHLDKLGVLFERYKNPLFSYFYRNTGNNQPSEDLVQTVFWRLLKYRHTFREEGNFGTWIYQIAHRVLIDQWSKGTKDSDINNIPDSYISHNDTAEDDLLADESLRLLSQAIRQLGPQAREILIMSKYQQLKYKEIGEILDCTEGAVKVRIFRALQELKEIYKKLEGT